MRLNKWLAAHTSYSRRGADDLVASGRVTINGLTAEPGQTVQPTDTVAIDSKPVTSTEQAALIVLLHKPVGFVCSHRGQGAPTVYSLLPLKYQHLNIAGRLDKDSSGLVLLTNNGDLLEQLTHPKNQKNKVYEVTLQKPLSPQHAQLITNQGVPLDDGPSKFSISVSTATAHGANPSSQLLTVTMHEGRNRQIRRTFEQLGYTVTSLKRTTIGEYRLGSLKSRAHTTLDPAKIKS